MQNIQYILVFVRQSNSRMMDNGTEFTYRGRERRFCLLFAVFYLAIGGPGGDIIGKNPRRVGHEDGNFESGGSGGGLPDRDPGGTRGTSESFCFCAVAWGTPERRLWRLGLRSGPSRTGASRGSEPVYTIEAVKLDEPVVFPLAAEGDGLSPAAVRFCAVWRAVTPVWWARAWAGRPGSGR